MLNDDSQDNGWRCPNCGSRRYKKYGPIRAYHLYEASDDEHELDELVEEELEPDFSEVLGTECANCGADVDPYSREQPALSGDRIGEASVQTKHQRVCRGCGGCWFAEVALVEGARSFPGWREFRPEADRKRELQWTTPAQATRQTLRFRCENCGREERVLDDLTLVAVVQVANDSEELDDEDWV